MEVKKPMGLFDFLRPKKSTNPRPVKHPELFSRCYEIAYYILPQYAHNEPAKLLSLWTDGSRSAGAFLYLMACQMAKTEPDQSEAIRFRPHRGELKPGTDFYVLEYPAPPPVDFSTIDLEDIIKDEQDDLPVLAPYFSAIIHTPKEPRAEYFILGQAPIGGGTTLRKVTKDSLNCNLGPGPAATLDGFLHKLRSVGSATT